MNITFHLNGTAHCLYTEAIPLQSIGQLEMTRASHIEFNQESQEWEVRDTDNQLLYSNTSRSACLDWEQQHFNQ